MPKRNKKSRADAPESSEPRSKKLYNVYLAEDLRSELRSWPKPDRARVGKPHLHSGAAIRDLSPKGSRLNIYECRIGRGLRLVFTSEPRSALYFHTIGNHDEVRRFLKSLL